VRAAGGVAFRLLQVAGQPATEPTPAAKRRTELDAAVAAAHEASDGVYGYYCRRIRRNHVAPQQDSQRLTRSGNDSNLIKRRTTIAVSASTERTEHETWWCSRRGAVIGGPVGLLGGGLAGAPAPRRVVRVEADFRPASGGELHRAGKAASSRAAQRCRRASARRRGTDARAGQAWVAGDGPCRSRWSRSDGYRWGGATDSAAPQTTAVMPGSAEDCLGMQDRSVCP